MDDDTAVAAAQWLDSQLMKSQMTFRFAGAKLSGLSPEVEPNPMQRGALKTQVSSARQMDAAVREYVKMFPSDEETK